MNHVERFRALMNFQEVDRTPRWEWAMWWDKTIERWHGKEIAPAELNLFYDQKNRLTAETAKAGNYDLTMSNGTKRKRLQIERH
jgi:hypothetical protein